MALVGVLPGGQSLSPAGRNAAADAFAGGMREINGVYTQAFNRRHGRVGHVLQGRYKAVLVDKDSYLRGTVALHRAESGARPVVPDGW